MRVPTLDLPRGSPSGQGAPNVRVDYAGGRDALERGLADIGHATDQVAAGMAHDAEIERQKAIAKETTDGETELTNYATDKFHGSKGSGDARRDAIEGAFNEEPVQQKGYLNMKGDEAFDSSTEVYTDLKKKQREIADNMSSQDSRDLFLHRTTPQMQSYYETVERHAGQQRQVADLATLEARKNAAIEAVRQNPNNLTAVDQQANALNGPIQALGLSDDDKKAKVREWHGQIATAQILAQLEERPGHHADWQSAETTLANKKELIGIENAHRLEAAVKVARDKATADRTAFDVIDSSRKPNGFVDTAKAIEAFKALPDSVRTEAAQQAFGKWMNAEEDKQKAVTNDYGDRALTAYLDNHTLRDVSPADEVWLRQNAPKVWHSMEQMQHADRALRESSSATPEQQAAMTKFLVDVADNPEKYAVMPLKEFNTTWLPQLAKHDRARAGEVLAHMHGQASKPDKLTPLEDRMLLQMGREAGLFDPKVNDVSKWDDEQAQNYYAAQRYLSKQASDWRGRKGESPPVEKVQEWVRDLLLKGKDPERGILGFGGGTTRLEAEVKGTGFVPKWDDDEKSAAVKALRAAGGTQSEITDTAIETYLRKKHGLPALPQQAAPPPNMQSETIVPGQWGIDASEDPVDLPLGD